MSKVPVLLEELLIALGAALCAASATLAESLVFGADPALVWQMAPLALLWLPLTLAGLWAAEWLVGILSAGAGEWGRSGARKVFRPFLAGWLCLAQPLLGFGSLGLPLIVLLSAACLWRLWSGLQGAEGRLSQRSESSLEHLGDCKAAALLFLLALVFYVAVISGVFAPLPQPEGDEPHYMIISYSLLADGDFELTSNYYENKDYLRWHAGEVQAHTKKGRGGWTEEFSMHTSGLALYLVPFMAVGMLFNNPAALHFAVRLGMVLLGAALIPLIYLTLRRLGSSRSLGVGASVIAGLTAPILFFAYHVFTELPAALLCLLAFNMLWREQKPRLPALVVVGLCIGALPWLGPKYIVLSLSFAVLWLARELRWGRRRSSTMAVVLPCAVLGLLFMWHTYGMFGTVNPSAYYAGAGGSILEKNPVFKVGHAAGPVEAAAIIGKTGLSYLVDQREGLLPYAPWYLLAVAGWLGMVFSREHRGLALWLLWLAGPFVFLYCLTGFGGGHSPPARALTAVIWAFIIPAAWMLPRAMRKARELSFILLFLSLLVSLALLFDPTCLYHDFHVPASHMLSGLSTPFLDAAALLPSVNSKHFENWAATAAWCVALAALVVWFLWKPEPNGAAVRRRAAGAGALILAAVATVYTFLAVTPPLAGGVFSKPGRDLEIHFQRGEVYIDPAAFWVRSGGREWCYLVSDEPIERVTLRLRTIASNLVILGVDGVLNQVHLGGEGASSTRATLGPRGGFHRGGKWVRRFYIESTGGIELGSEVVPGDARPLGVEVTVFGNGY